MSFHLLKPLLPVRTCIRVHYKKDKNMTAFSLNFTYLSPNWGDRLYL